MEASRSARAAAEEAKANQVAALGTVDVTSPYSEQGASYISAEGKTAFAQLSFDAAGEKEADYPAGGFRLQRRMAAVYGISVLGDYRRIGSSLRPSHVRQVRSPDLQLHPVGFHRHDHGIVFEHPFVGEMNADLNGLALPEVVRICRGFAIHKQGP